MRELQAKLLERGIEIAGGEKALCVALQIDPRALRAWRDGEAALPQRVFLALVELVTDDGITRAAMPNDRRGASGPRAA